jgi:hypothetical protein
MRVDALCDWKPTRPCRALALPARAVGYHHDAVKIFCKKDGEIIEAPYVEHVPPDVTARSSG